MNIETRLRNAVMEIPDFPVPGVIFKDITPIFLQPQLCEALVREAADYYRGRGIEAVLGLESRGFLLGLPLAMSLGIPFVMARKKGKLPRAVHSVNYALEYGTATLEIHCDALRPDMSVLIHDDVLATGGTAEAAAGLVSLAGARLSAFHFLIELKELKGREHLARFGADISTFAAY